MRVIFFYVSWKHGFGSRTPWDPDIKSNNYYALRFLEEGYFLLLKKLYSHNVIDNAIVFIESRNQPGFFDCRPLNGYVVPSIEDVEPFLRPDDIIFVRGGWKHWHNILKDWRDQGHWTMIYAANTGRQKWKFWDVVLNDLTEKIIKDGAGRIHLPFRKPINEDIFYGCTITKQYDLMIGASRIHDRKGQWRAINALIEYKKIFGENLKAILPGPWARGVETNKIRSKIKEHGLDVYIPGTMTRRVLALAMNRSRIFAHLGSHGQGDRGPMEAMSCGCPVLIGFSQYHASWVSRERKFCLVSKNPHDPKNIAIEMRELLHEHHELLRMKISHYKSKNAGLIQRCVPDLEKVFEMFRNCPSRRDGELEVHL